VGILGGFQDELLAGLVEQIKQAGISAGYLVHETDDLIENVTEF
jgi:hypothetical protein